MLDIICKLVFLLVSYLFICSLDFEGGDTHYKDD